VSQGYVLTSSSLDRNLGSGSEKLEVLFMDLGDFR
jgi:hypothetical protein